MRKIFENTVNMNGKLVTSLIDLDSVDKIGFNSDVSDYMYVTIHGVEIGIPMLPSQRLNFIEAWKKRKDPTGEQ